MWKHHEWKQVWEERVYLAYISESIHHWRKSWQELKPGWDLEIGAAKRPWRVLLAGLLSMAWNGQSPPHQSLIKKMRHILNWSSILCHDLSLCQDDMKLSSTTDLLWTWHRITSLLSHNLSFLVHPQALMLTGTSRRPSVFCGPCAAMDAWATWHVGWEDSKCWAGLNAWWGWYFSS